VLGPVLFTIYVSDIPQRLDNFISLFADDTKLYSIIEHSEDSDSLQEDLNNIQDWANKMGMKFNEEKCFRMHLGRSNQGKAYTMESESEHQLTRINHEKDLGVTLDDKLKFNTHIQEVVKKANRTLGNIKHSFKHLDKDLFLMLYKGLVRPHLEYASCVWAPSTKRDQDHIEQVQRWATRVVPELAGMGYEDRIRALNLPTLVYRRSRADLIQTFKIINKIDTVNGDARCRRCEKKMFVRSTEERTRGHSYKLKAQMHRGARSSFFSERVVNNWNRLKEETVQAETVAQFKVRLHREHQNSGTDMFSYRFSY
jgi:hypothetical protein